MAIVTTEQLRDWLGVDSDSDDTIARERAGALESLRDATGVDWVARDDNALASEAVEVMVWLSFYGTRSNVGNEEMLRQRLVYIITQLQYRGE